MGYMIVYYYWYSSLKQDLDKKGSAWILLRLGLRSERVRFNLIMVVMNTIMVMGYTLLVIVIVCSGHVMTYTSLVRMYTILVMVNTVLVRSCENAPGPLMSSCHHGKQ